MFLSPFSQTIRYQSTTAKAPENTCTATVTFSRILYEIDTQPTELSKELGKNYEHFGFRDGISQPVIRGTQRFVCGALPHDIMAAGEFLLGYKSNQGYSPRLRSSTVKPMSAIAWAPFP